MKLTYKRFLKIEWKYALKIFILGLLIASFKDGIRRINLGFVKVNIKRWKN